MTIKLFLSSILLIICIIPVISQSSWHQWSSRSQRNHRTSQHYNKNWPWWKKAEQSQGPHVCAYQVISQTEQRFGFPWVRGAYCMQRTTIKHECCPGFSHLRGEPGCSSIRPLKNIIVTAKEMGSTSLVHTINATGLSDILSKAGAFTLFLPDNAGFMKVPEEMKEKLTTMQMGDKSNGIPLLMYHVIARKIASHEFSNNMMIETLYNQPIRINRFPHGLITANCAPLLKMDFPASNGIIHMIDRVLTPAYDNTITDLIMADKHLNRLATALVQANMNDLLREKGPFTIFAPTNEAFFHDESDILENLNKDLDALTALLKYHIIPGVMCASTIHHHTKMKTMEGSFIDLRCNQTHLLVNHPGVIAKEDIMAGNGVIHIINRVLIPRRAKSVMEITGEMKLTKVMELLGPANMENALSVSGPYTFFVPSDDAFEDLPETIQEKLHNNATYAQEIILYHIATGRYLTSQMVNDQQMMSLDEINDLRIKVFNKKLSVEGAIVQKGDIEGRNGVIHLINKVLFPPDQTIIDYLKADGNFSTLVQCLTISSSRLIHQLSNRTKKWTIFAPSNEVFKSLPFGTLERMLMDPQLLFKVIEYHVLKDIVVTGALLNKVYYIYPTLGNTDTVKIYRERNQIRIGPAVITEPDIMTINGVIHKISHVILPE